MDMELDPRRSIMNHAQSGYPYPEPEEPRRWQELANCKGADPELFFPTQGDWLTERMAKAICDGCIVREECLDFALKERIKGGIFGGESERQRRIMRRHLRLVRDIV